MTGLGRINGEMRIVDLSSEPRLQDASDFCAAWGNTGAASASGCRGMGELIEFKKGPGNVWDDAGEAFPDEGAADSPKPGLLILPILLFLDGFSLVLALFCRPIAATLLIAGGAAIWAVLRDLIGIAAPWALVLCLVAWLIGHFLNRNIDQVIKAIEAGESAIMRAAAQRHAALGRALHLALYLYVAAAPIGFVALLTGALPAPSWLPPSLGLPMIRAVPPLLALACALLPAAAAVATRYYWHPVARHATLLGGKRKFTVAARTEAAE
jgi:hypothetical protein